jgi:hypothetical protein
VNATIPARWPNVPVLRPGCPAPRALCSLQVPAAVEAGVSIKERILVGGFLLRGLEKVGAEVCLAHWAYNFKRVVQIVGAERLLEAIGRGGKRPPGAAGPRGPRREPTRGAKREHFHFHFRRAGRSECRQMLRRVYFILRPVVSVSLAHETNRFSHSL